MNPPAQFDLDLGLSPSALFFAAATASVWIRSSLLQTPVVHTHSRYESYGRRNPGIGYTSNKLTTVFMTRVPSRFKKWAKKHGTWSSCWAFPSFLLKTFSYTVKRPFFIYCPDTSASPWIYTGTITLLLHSEWRRTSTGTWLCSYVAGTRLTFYNKNMVIAT